VSGTSRRNRRRFRPLLEGLEERAVPAAGDLEWVRQFGTGVTRGNAVTVGPAGDVFVVGDTTGALPGQTATGNRDAFASRYDASGNLLWVRQFGSTWGSSAYGVAADATGNVYVVGIDISDQPGFVSKYDGAGNLLWSQHFGANSTLEVRGVALDAAGNVYVAGATSGPWLGPGLGGIQDAFVLKYDGAGDPLWARRFGAANTATLAYGVAVDASGSVYVAGYAYAYTILPTGPLPTGPGGISRIRQQPAEAFVDRFDSDGNPLWARQFGSADWDLATGVATDSAGNVYLAGYTWAALPGQTSAGGFDVFVCKYDQAGTPLWARQFGTAGYDTPWGVAVGAAKDVYVAGRTDGTWPGQTSAGSGDAFVASYDSDGNPLWTRQFGSPADDGALAVAASPAGPVYVVGETNGTFPGQAGTGGEDTFLAKITGNIPPSTPGVFDPATGIWYLRDSATPGAPNAGQFAYGAPGWIPLVGDWDGNGTVTVGVFDPGTATFYLRNSNGPGAPDIAPFRYGGPGWVPVVGDWDGDGKTTIGVVDPRTETWYLKNSNGPGAPDVAPFAYGAPGWVPVAGDWDGDGKTTIGVLDPALATWYLKNSNAPGAPDVAPFAYGGPGWRPVVGDWDEDGKDTIGVFDPQGHWYLRNSNSAGAPDVSPFAYGAGEWLPVSGGWDPVSPGTAAGGAQVAARAVSLTSETLGRLPDPLEGTGN
jgi:hypothetical protein